MSVIIKLAHAENSHIYFIYSDAGVLFEQNGFRNFGNNFLFITLTVKIEVVWEICKKVKVYMKVALCSMLSKQESYSDHVTNTTAEIPKLSIFTSNLDKTKLCLNLINWQIIKKYILDIYEISLCSELPLDWVIFTLYLLILNNSLTFKMELTE